MTHDVFICHSSKDRIIANAICATLEQNRIRCWIAPRDVLPGMEYAGAIVEAITATKLTVLVFSGNSNASPHVRREVERTVSHGIPVLPFRIEDVVPSPALEYFISDAHWLDAMTPPLEQHLDHLVGTVRLLLERQAAFAAPTAAAAPTASAQPATWAPPPLPTPTQVGSLSVGAPPIAPTTPTPRPAWQWAALATGGIAAVVLAGMIVIPGLSGPRSAVATSPPPSQTAGQATPTVAPTPTLTPTATAAGPVIPTDNPADDFFDPFDFDVADPWTWWAEDPELWTADDPFGWLTLTAPAKPPLANVLLYEPRAEGFGITTLLRFDPTSEHQLAGVVLTGADPDADRLQFGWGYCTDAGCMGKGLYFSEIVAGKRERHYVSTLDGSPTEIYLGLTVIGNGETDERRVVIAQFSYDGGDDWFDGGTIPFDDRFTRIGLIVLDAADQISASFEYAYVARYME